MGYGVEREGASRRSCAIKLIIAKVGVRHSIVLYFNGKVRWGNFS